MSLISTSSISVGSISQRGFISPPLLSALSTTLFYSIFMYATRLTYIVKVTVAAN